MHRHTLRFIAAFILAVLSPAAAHTQQWTTSPVLRIGEEQGTAFGMVASIAAAPDGRFYVLDRMESRVLAFSADGTLEHSFGQRGEGPGELSRLATHLLISGDQLVIVDLMNQRINLFETDGTFVDSRPLNRMHGMPTAWAVAGDRVAMLVRPMPGPMAARFGGVTKHTVFSIDPRTDVEADTLMQLDLPDDTEITMGASAKMKVDLGAPHLLLTGDGSGRILLAQTDAYRIRVMDVSGSTTGWLSRDVERHRYTRAELARMRQEADSSIGRAMNAGAAAGGRGRPVQMPEVDIVMPEHAPALTAMIGGDRFVLVAPGSGASGEPASWDVIDYRGRILGTLRLPDGFRPHVVSGDIVYGVERDEYDVDSVVLYRLAPPP